MIPVGALLCLFLAGPVFSQKPPQNTPVIRVVRIAVGPGGAESGGRYILREERTTFSREADRQVVVTFEWDGRMGQHRIKATWRNLDTSTSSTSEIEYTATAPRFGSYWILPLTETTPLGQWRLDVTVDDEPAGVAAFEVAPAGTPDVKRRAVLSTAELYERATGSSVALDRLDSNGVRLAPAAAVVTGQEQLVTALAAIDGATTVRVKRPDNKDPSITSLAAWHPRQGWAIVAVPSLSVKPAAPASVQPVVGDRCYSLVFGADGSRVLAEGSISGEQRASDTPRLLATFIAGVPTIGAPVLNDAGETIGIVRDSTEGTESWHWRTRMDSAATMIVPLGTISPASGRPGGPMTDLLSQGLLVAPLAYDQNLVSGGFAPRLAKVAGSTQPVDQRYDFSPQDGSIVVFVVWNPQQRIKGMATLKVYDQDRRQITESQPLKLDVRGGSRGFTDWKLTMPDAPGIYRVEVLVGGRVAWRDYFRVSR